MFVPKVLTESGLKGAEEILRISSGKGSQGVKELCTKLSVLMFQNRTHQLLLGRKCFDFPFQNDLGAIKRHTGIFS